MSRPLESKIQREIVVFLEKHGWIVNKIIQCSKNGWTDLEAFRQYPQMIFIECKRPGEEPEDLQKYRHDKLRKLGWTVIVADKVEDVHHLR